MQMVKIKKRGEFMENIKNNNYSNNKDCLLYTSDAADD